MVRNLVDWTACHLTCSWIEAMADLHLILVVQSHETAQKLSLILMAEEIELAKLKRNSGDIQLQ